MFFNLMYAMKGTEDIILHNTGSDNGISINIRKQVEENRVAQSLLRGEVTQAVEELRYRTYLVDKESKDFNYFAPTLALRKDKQDSKFVKWDDSDGLELITVQPNDMLVENVLETLEQVGGRGKRTEHRIKVKRSFVPRYRIEDYMKRIDVKKLDEKHVILDMYFSIYTNELDFKSKGFVRELEKIRDEHIKSDILDYEEISFISSHALKVEDLTKFTFRNIWFKEIKEFDGHFILRFKSSYEMTGNDLTKKYYSKTMAQKYETNAEKERMVAQFAITESKPKYTCENCGKEVVFDEEVINAITAYEGRDITSEEFNNQSPHVLEYYDMQVSEQTFGRRLCSDCLKKYLEENNII